MGFERMAFSSYTMIKLSEKGKTEKNEFKIENVIGYGANSIVYSAYQISNNIRVIIKEFYPYNLELTRNSDLSLNIVSNSENDFNNRLSQFEKICDLHIEFQNDYVTSNVTSKINNIYYGYNTLYVVMSYDFGNELSINNEHNLYYYSSILSSTANAIKKYHDKGYLHLDIKPENIFIYPETENIVKLFDFDSVTHIDCIKDNKINLSYSYNWAAPELKQMKISNIDKRTDFYSIGVIMFSYIFGRFPNALEITILCGKYEYKDVAKNIFDNVDFNVQDLLNEFFKKTINAYNEYRYFTDDELIFALEQIKELSSPKRQYLHSNFNYVFDYFIGRDIELQQIHKNLYEDGQSVIFLTGIGGIGKTELARRYAYEYSKYYDTIIYGIYQGSILSFICDDSIFYINNFSKFDGEDDKSYLDRKLNKLKDLVDSKTLVIVDNYNLYDGNINSLLNLGCKVIFTTRNTMEDFDYCNLQICALDKQQSKALFLKYYKTVENSEESEYISELLQLISYHTITIQLIAKQITKSRIKISSKLIDKFKKLGIKEMGKEKFKNQKDDNMLSQNAYDHLSTIFDLSYMSEKEKSILRNLCLIPYSGIHIQDFKEWCMLDSFDDINYLIESGWIICDEINYVISLHPVIAEVCFNKLLPNSDNCKDFLTSVFNYLNVDDNMSKYDTINQKVNISKYLFNKLEIKSDLDIDLNIVFLEKMYVNCDYTVLNEENVTNLISKCISYLGFENLKISDLYNKVGSFYKNICLYDKAIEYYKIALDIRNKLCGEKSLLYAKSVHNLATIFQITNRYDFAIEYENKALNIKLPLDNLDYSSVIITYRTLYSIYVAMGKYKLAFKSIEKAMDLIENIDYEDKYSDIAYLYTDKANIYKLLCEHYKSIDMYNEALKIRISIFGEYSKGVAFVYSRMGIVYKQLCQYDKAIEMYNNALKIRISILGENHSDVAGMYNSLGEIYREQSEYDKSIDMYNKALKISTAISGKDSKGVAFVYSRMGIVYKQLCQYDKAIEMYNNALKIRISILGENHSDVAGMYNSLGELYRVQEKYDKSIEMYKKALEINLSIFTENHLSTSISYNNIAEVYYYKEDYEKAIELYKKSFKIREKLFEPKHDRMSYYYIATGDIFKKKNEYDKALDMYKKALEIRSVALGEIHKKVADLNTKIGDVYYDKSDYNLAIYYYNKAVDIYRLLSIDKHIDITEIYTKIGNTYIKSENNSFAKQNFEYALKIFENYPYKELEINNIKKLMKSL